MMRKNLKYYEALPYRILLSFDQEDAVWIAHYPELPGCLAHGATREEALRASETMKSLWLETLIENGEVPPEPCAIFP